MFEAGHLMSEIHLKLMLVQNMPESPSGSLLLLHPLNHPLKSSNGSKIKPFPMCA